MIQLDRLSKSYGPVEALKDVSLTISTGEIIGLLGPNGAGKTTAMKVITCFMPPTSGSVKVDGLDVVDESLEVRKKIGYLPEHNPLYLDMSVDEYLAYCSQLHQIPKADQGSAIDRAVQRCGLLEHRNRHIGQLSKGFRQRVGLAQAILHDPEVLVLDEPTSGLDPNQILEIRNLIKELGKEKTVILSTHIMQEVQAVCSRVLIINQGQIVADDTASNLLDRGKSTRYDLIFEKGIEGASALFEDALPLLRTSSQEENGELKLCLFSESDEDLRSQIFKIVKDKDMPLLEMTRQRNTLEDVFRDLTTDPTASPSSPEGGAQ
jgi:ABC-2 type transport system ATP-binding protein